MYSVDDYANAFVYVCVFGCMFVCSVYALYCGDLRSAIDVIMRDQFHSINCQYMSANHGGGMAFYMN